MPYVKLDCGMLDSSLWLDVAAREIFVTALLMAVPHELTSPCPQLKVGSLELTGWTVPAGWYGFVAAAGPGIVERSKIPPDVGTAALERLGEPDPDSRSEEYEGRRLVRINGGYVVLNYMVYRDKDFSAAERSRRYRRRKKQSQTGQTQDQQDPPSRDVTRDTVASRRDAEPDTVTPWRHVTSRKHRAESIEQSTEGVGVQEPLEGTRPPANSPPPHSF